MGTGHQILGGGTLQKYRIELAPMRTVIGTRQFDSVAERLVELVQSNISIQDWRLGVAKRYSRPEFAKSAIIKVASSRDMRGWVVLRKLVDDEHILNLDPSLIMGVATMQEGLIVEHRGRQLGKHALASYWLESPAISIDGCAVADALFGSVATQVLRNPGRVFASIDGPVPATNNPDTSLDPSAEFAVIGDRWDGARAIVEKRQSPTNGTVVDAMTRLYRPRPVISTDTTPLQVQVTENEHISFLQEL